MKTISQAMIKEHAQVNAVFDLFKQKLNSLSEKEPKSHFRDLSGDFNRFKWSLEKHIFTEEKVVIDSYLSEEENSKNGDVEQILKEHKEIIDVLNEIEEDLIAGFKPASIEVLTELINEHEQGEENYFYPKLDEELSPELKNQIVEKCEEVIFG